MFVFVYEDNSIAYIGNDIDFIQGAKKIKIDDDLEPFDYSDYEFMGGEFVKVDYSRLGEITAALSAIDARSIRALRAIAAGKAEQRDYDELEKLENERLPLVDELRGLTSE